MACALRRIHARKAWPFQDAHDDNGDVVRHAAAPHNIVLLREHGEGPVSLVIHGVLPRKAAEILGKFLHDLLRHFVEGGTALGEIPLFFSTEVLLLPGQRGGAELIELHVVEESIRGDDDGVPWQHRKARGVCVARRLEAGLALLFAGEVPELVGEIECLELLLALERDAQVALPQVPRRCPLAHVARNGAVDVPQDHDARVADVAEGKLIELRVERRDERRRRTRDAVLEGFLPGRLEHIEGPDGVLLAERGAPLHTGLDARGKVLHRLLGGLHEVVGEGARVVPLEAPLPDAIGDAHHCHGVTVLVRARELINDKVRVIAEPWVRRELPRPVLPQAIRAVAVRELEGMRQHLGGDAHADARRDRFGRARALGAGNPIPEHGKEEVVPAARVLGDLAARFLLVKLHAHAGWQAAARSNVLNE
mmetsp:Transcript_23394/g.73381  ORF Transcript_23394/g.73381 Transcript_23394/m.73381 type:complete len:423 (-) Transcript_23394:838-2106(-)